MRTMDSRILFSSDPRWAVGQSLRDPQWSFQRGVKAIAHALNNTPRLTVNRQSVRGGPAVDVDISFVWMGPDPCDAPLTPEEALTTGRSVCARYKVEATIAVRSAEQTVGEDRCVLTLEIPLVIGGLSPEMCPPPPETGYVVAKGSEFCLRYHERFMFGSWVVVVSKKGSPVASMRLPPRELGGISRALRVTLAEGGVVTCLKRRVSLGAIVFLLGDSSETFAARCSRGAPDIAWPGSREQAEALLQDTGEGATDPATFVDSAVLPHLASHVDRLESLAHACDLLAADTETGAVHDLDDLQHKRMDAPGDMIAFQFGASWQNLLKKFPQDLVDEALPVHHTRTADTVDVGSVVCEASAAALDRMFTDLNNSLLNGFIKDSWTGGDGTATKGACVAIKRQNVANAVALMRRTRSSLGEGGSRKRETRLAHPSAFGLLCPVETPDDDNIGLVKAFSSSTRTSSACDARSWIPRPESVPGAWRLVVNGLRQPGGVNPAAFFKSFRLARLTAVKNASTPHARFAASCVTAWACTSSREIKVWSDSGRLVRPLLLYGYSHIRTQPLDTLISEGYAEYVDAGAFEDPAFVIDVGNGALTDKPTFAEFHPAMHLGLMAARIPFANFNQVGGSAPLDPRACGEPVFQFAC